MFDRSFQDLFTQAKAANLRQKIHLAQFAALIIQRKEAVRPEQSSAIVLNYFENSACLDIANLDFVKICILRIEIKRQLKFGEYARHKIDYSCAIGVGRRADHNLLSI